MGLTIGESLKILKVHGIMVENASDIIVNGLIMDWGKDNFPNKGGAHKETNARNVIVKAIAP